jgi:LysM repeat protein
MQVGQVVFAGPTYSVQKGDDILRISRRFGVTVEDVLLWNPDIDETVQDTG